MRGIPLVCACLLLAGCGSGRFKILDVWNRGSPPPPSLRIGSVGEPTGNPLTIKVVLYPVLESGDPGTFKQPRIEIVVDDESGDTWVGDLDIPETAFQTAAVNGTPCEVLVPVKETIFGFFHFPLEITLTVVYSNPERGDWLMTEELTVKEP